MNDYIRKAVELADGFDIVTEKDGTLRIDTPLFAGYPCPVPHPPQMVLDALAAQLVRQVDALDFPVMVIASRDATSIVEPDETFYSPSQNEGRTMNTIKAIVDSGVLK